MIREIERKAANGIAVLLILAYVYFRGGTI